MPPMPTSCRRGTAFLPRLAPIAQSSSRVTAKVPSTSSACCGERIAGQPVAKRIAAAYVIGWPVSVTTDLPKLGLPACASADQSGCILSWQSFAEPADTHQIAAVYDSTTGFNGQSRRGTKMLCTNPLTGVPDSSADAAANIGAAIPSLDLKTATLESGTIPARCDDRGFLLIGGPPKGISAYVLPGNNYHVLRLQPVLGQYSVGCRAAAGGVYKAPSLQGRGWGGDCRHDTKHPIR